MLFWASVCVFVTTYHLILPAISVEKDNVDNVSGLYLEDAEVIDEDQYPNTKPTLDDIVTDAPIVSVQETPNSVHEKSTHINELSASGDSYEIFVTYDDKAGIPDGAQLEVQEIKQDPEASNSGQVTQYDEYIDSTSDTLGCDAGLISYARVFDICIVKDGEKIDPKGTAVDVRCELSDAIEENELSVVNFTDGADAGSVVENSVEGQTVEFAAEESAVYVIVGTTIEKTVLASDGLNYRITATYGLETGIPEGAGLEVNEILPEEQGGANASSAYDISYEEYVAYTENALGMEEGSAGYIRLFDIKIVDRDDPSVRYQPVEGTAVNVVIELADAEPEEGKTLNVVHFEDSRATGDVVVNSVESIEEGRVVSFKANSFSVYAIIDGDQSTGETYSIKYTFVLDDGQDTPFYFTNKNGDSTNIQYVKDGEIPINPGTPTISSGEQEDKEFAGWWTKNGSAWGTELSFEDPVSTSSNQAVVVYARYDNTQYITYYDENGTVYIVDRRHENDIVLTTDLKNSVTGERWTEHELEDYKYVAYQPLSKTTAFLGWTATQGKTTPDDNFTITEATNLYPVIADVKWVTYHSGPNGSNATYFGAEYALDGDWDRTSLADHVPTRAGYRFDGWYIRNTATQGDDDNLDYSWTVSSSDVQVTNASGAFVNGFRNNSSYFENGKLKNDTELVAHWTPTTVDYVFVYYQQEPNASEDGTYDYVYKDSVTASGVSESHTGTPPVPTWDDIDGFSLHSTSDSSDPYNVKTEVIEGDGSTVVNVYYDRNEYTVTFYERRSGSGYILNNDATNNVYGYKDGEFVPLTRESHSETTWILSRYNYGSIAYTGNIYDRSGNIVNNPIPGNTYYRDGNGRYPLYWRSTTTTSYSWNVASTGEAYTGNRFTYTSNSYSNQWFVINDLTIEAKYGEDVSLQWPDKRTDLSTAYPSMWYTSEAGSVAQSGLGIMPPNNLIFYKREGQTGSEDHMKYWLQDLPGSSDGVAPNTFTLTYEDIFYGDWSTTWDDYWIFEGFTINIRTSDAATINNNNGVEVATTNDTYLLSDPIGSGFSSAPERTINVYYLRNQYSVTFQQGNIVIGSDDYYYEADISGADKYSSSVDVPAGMRFVGWYDNPEGIGQRYSFDGRTMPPNNLILYAKLVPEEYYVRMDYNGGVTKGAEATFAWLDYGETIAEAEDVRRDYVAVADGETGTHNYVYWHYDEEADANGDGWWSYYEDADGNKVYNDPKDYSQRTASYVEESGGNYKYDPGKYTFVGWYETDEEGNQISNVPFNFATQITKDTYLKAVFRKEGSFQVRYLPDMGTEGEDGYVAGDPDTAPPTDSYTYIDLSEAKIGHSVEPADDKYQFSGWRVRGTTGPLYQPGETFPINSDYAEEENGIQYITLEPVFIQKGDTNITYEINTPAGATANETALNGLTDNIQPKLILDGAVNLHSGEGFSVSYFNLIGWSDKPLQPSVTPVHLKEDGTYEGEIPSDTHIFKLGGTYGVSDENGNTLYAVWERKTIPVPFIKQGEKEDGTYEQLAGAEFKLYTDQECTNLASSVYADIAMDESVVTSDSSSGTNVIFPKVPVGTYYFAETSVGNSYKLDNSKHTIVVTEADDGTLSYTIDGKSYTSEEPFIIKNYLKGTLVVTKTVDSVVEDDETKDFSFTATVLNVSNAADTTINGTYGDLTFTNGVASFTLKHGEGKTIRNLVRKTVTITENGAEIYTTTANAASSTGNYDENSRTYTITILDDGDTVNFENKLEGVPVRVLKIDYTGSPLEGAGFYFTGKDFDGNEETELERKTRYVSAKVNNNSEEAVVIEREAVPIGTYTLHEETVPVGYIGLTGDIEISVSPGTGGNIEVIYKVGDTQYTGPTYINQVDGTWIIRIMNTAGYELPATGGPGTHLIYLLGIIFTSLAGTGLMMRRRRRNAA